MGNNVGKRLKHGCEGIICPRCGAKFNIYYSDEGCHMCWGHRCECGLHWVGCDNLAPYSYNTEILNEVAESIAHMTPEIMAQSYWEIREK